MRRAMEDNFKLPDDCTDMREVRIGVDSTDRELMELLARRFGYMRAAARIKTDRNVVRDEPRKAEVIANARMDAENRDLPAGEIAKIWDDLVEASIAYELEEWDRLRSAVIRCRSSGSRSASSRRRAASPSTEKRRHTAG